MVNSELSFLETDLQRKREEGVSESSAERLLVGKASTRSEDCEHRDMCVCIYKHLQENQQTPLGLVVWLEKGLQPQADSCCWIPLTFETACP